MKLQKNLGAIGIILIVILYYKLFIFTAIPPTNGWWNYYGWQLASGANLYSDIYCYIPPGFPWLCMALYKIFNNDIWLFYCFGVSVSALTSLIVYLLICRMISPIGSLIATTIGTLITCGFLPHLPFDYNPILHFVVILLAYFMSDIDRFPQNSFVVGILLGISFLIKQTSIVYGIVFLLVWCVYNYKNGISENLVNRLIKILIGILVVVIPTGVYLCLNGTLYVALQEISHASAAKGVASDVFSTLVHIATRFYNYGFSFTVILLTIFLLAKSVMRNKNIDEITKKKIYDTFNYMIFSLIIFKILRDLQIADFNNSNLFYIAILLGLAYWMWYLFRDAKFIINIYSVINGKLNVFKQNKYLIIIPFMAIVFIMLICQVFGYDYLEPIYTYGAVSVPWLLKRNISDISYWGALFWCIWVFFKSKASNTEKDMWIFVIGIVLFQSMILVGSGSLDEGFSLGTVSFAMAYLVRNKTINRYVFVCCICFFVIVSSVVQKQCVSYDWHGWKCRGLNNSGIVYVDSKIPELHGFTLDLYTEYGYENIIDAIKIYSLPTDNVYEFPHSPLFNVLTNRRLGTFAVSHFFDVCPDDVFLDDYEYLKENEPKIFIWIDLEESVWTTHENYFRNGQDLAAREMVTYYEDHIRETYQFVYQFKNISVYVKNPTKEQNLEFANKQTENYLSLISQK